MKFQGRVLTVEAESILDSELTALFSEYDIQYIEVCDNHVSVTVNSNKDVIFRNHLLGDIYAVDLKRQNLSFRVPNSSLKHYFSIEEPFYKHTICTKCNENPADRDSELCAWCKPPSNEEYMNK